MTSVVISLKLYEGTDKAEAVADVFRSVVNQMLNFPHEPMANAVPSEASVSFYKPHWFKRVCERALTRFTVSVRVPESVANKLKPIIGWQDTLRKFFYALTKQAQEYQPWAKTVAVKFESVEYELADEMLTFLKSGINSSPAFNGRQEIRDRFVEKAIENITELIDQPKEILEFELDGYTNFNKSEVGLNSLATFKSLMVKAIKRTLEKMQ
jgi:hypothetical protein